MPIRLKVTVLVVFLAFISIFSIYFVSEKILINKFDAIEDERVLLNLNRASNAYETIVQHLNNFTSDYAYWDDMFSFINTKDPKFIGANFVPQTLSNMKANIVVILDNNYQIVYKTSYDLENNTETPFPNSLLGYLNQDSPLFKYANNNSVVWGIVNMPQGLLVVSTRNILDSNGNGIPNGKLLMGQYLTKSVISNIASSVKLDFSIYPIEKVPDADSKVVVKLLNSEDPIVQPVDSKTISGYKMVRDIAGNPAVVFKASMPREIYTQGQNALHLLIIILSALNLLTLFVVSAFFEFSISRRLRVFVSEVTHVQNTKDLKKRINVSGKDEISDLATGVNNMLDSLEQSDLMLREVNSVLGQKAAELERKTTELEKINKFMLGREIKMSELKKQIEDLKKGSGK